ncbi:MAG: ATP-binding protein [Crocinitomicaceae bacterium]|nr:ATP-binding protein [Crocinitomicaceae bacterium]
MESQQKTQIAELIKLEKSRLGSFAAVAKKCKVSEATISLMRNLNGDQLTESLWLQVANSLGYKSDNWNIARTTRDYLYVNQLCANAKEKSMFVMISEVAGSGKTTGLEQFCIENAAQASYYIKAREWSAKVFMQRLLDMLGVGEPRGYHTADELIDVMVANLTPKRNLKPIICIDETDKLKPAAKRILIYLFNEFEDQISLVIAGTENLKKEIEAGVKYAKKGYDEIESRFGRVYIPMIGSNKKDVFAICEANGIKDNFIKGEIWKEVGTKYKEKTDGRSELVCSDLRRLKKIIQREQIRK